MCFNAPVSATMYLFSTIASVLILQLASRPEDYVIGVHHVEEYAM